MIRGAKVGDPVTITMLYAKPEGVISRKRRQPPSGHVYYLVEITNSRGGIHQQGAVLFARPRWLERR